MWASTVDAASGFGVPGIARVAMRAAPGVPVCDERSSTSSSSAAFAFVLARNPWGA
jgi:hypothetical protein